MLEKRSNNCKNEVEKNSWNSAFKSYRFEEWIFYIWAYLNNATTACTIEYYMNMLREFSWMAGYLPAAAHSLAISKRKTQSASHCSQPTVCASVHFLFSSHSDLRQFNAIILLTISMADSRTERLRILSSFCCKMRHPSRTNVHKYNF